MDKEITIEKIVYLLRTDNLMFKSVVNYINSARKGCLDDSTRSEVKK